MKRTLIRGGTVVDGTGAPARPADVLVDDGIIVDVGRVSAAGAEVVDAAGLLVTPGWVDIHTHYDGQVFWDPLLTPSSSHGATTVVMGNCGVGFAPVRADQHEVLIELMMKIEDIPTATLRAGIPWGWETFGEYLDTLDRTRFAIDVGAFVPHGVARTYVMGERAERGTATMEDIAAMVEIVDEALRVGALGCSANRTQLKGSLVPGSFAADDELLAIAQVVGKWDGIIETSPAAFAGLEDWTNEEAEFDLLRRQSLAGDCPVTFPLIEDHQDPTRWRRIMGWIEAANASGAQLVPQVLPRPLNAVLTLGGRQPFEQLSIYRQLTQGLEFPQLVDCLSDPGVRERVLSEARRLMANTTVFNSLYRLVDPPDYEPDPDQSITAVARRQGRSPVDVLYDGLLEDGGQAMFLVVAANYAEGNGETVLEMIRDPATVIGLGDGGAHCVFLCDATAPTTVLTQWVRDRTRGPRLPLEIAVQELTFTPARRFGFGDRGLLTPGYRADVNLIDFDRLGMGAPEFVSDLPAGGRRLVQRAQGYVATYVAGQPILHHGIDTGARPGRLVRRDGSAP
jgi:N-acyl-D-amino-acid deacylase